MEPGPDLSVALRPSPGTFPTADRPRRIGGVAATLTDVTGAAKIGKTRFRNYLIRCLIRGESCLGYPASTPTKIVLLTEEPIPSLMEGLAAAGLTDTRDLEVLTRYASRATAWPDMVATADAKATEIGARVLMVETAPGMARLEGDTENSAGHALAALRPLQETQTPGLAKLVIRHTRKSGGDLVEAGRGSSAFAGEADVLISIKRYAVTVRLSGVWRPSGGSRRSRRC